MAPIKFTVMLFILFLVLRVISSGAPIKQSLLPHHFLRINLILVPSDDDVTTLLSLFEVPPHAEPAALPSPQQALHQSRLHSGFKET